MDSTKRIIKFQNKDSIKSLLWFWGVMLLVNIFFYVLNARGIPNMNIGVSKGIDGMTLLSVAGFNIMPLTIFFISFSFQTYYESFPIALSFSATRGNYYKSIILSNIIISTVSALVLSILFKIDPIIIRAIGKTPMIDFSIFNTSIDSIIYMFFALTMCFLTIFSITNLVVVLSYKFGYKFWISIGVLTLFSLAFGLRISLWNLFVDLLNTRFNTLQLIRLGFIMMFSYILGYTIVIKTNINNKIS